MNARKDPYVVMSRGTADVIAQHLYATGDVLLRRAVERALEGRDWVSPLLRAVLEHADADCAVEAHEEGCDACAWDTLLRAVPNRVLRTAADSEGADR